VLVNSAETTPISSEEIIEGHVKEDKGSDDLIAELKSDASRSDQMDNPPIRIKKKMPIVIRIIPVICWIRLFMPVSISRKRNLAIIYCYPIISCKTCSYESILA
jgi:hypothetical protein